MIEQSQKNIQPTLSEEEMKAKRERNLQLLFEGARNGTLKHIIWGCDEDTDNKEEPNDQNNT